MQVKESANTFQKAAVTQRVKAESAPPGLKPAGKPRTASLDLPQNQIPSKPLAKSGLPKNPNPGVTTSLPKKQADPDGPSRQNLPKQDFKGSPGPTKGPGNNAAPKAKGPDGPGPGVRPGGNQPKAGPPPDRPPPAKRPPPDEGKKKGR
jgi:hypothetical protein